MPINIGRTSKVQEAPIQKLQTEVKIPKDVVSLGQGVPFFGPPEEAVAAASNALAKESGFKYTEDAGLPSLRNAIADKLLREYQIQVDPDSNIMVTAGGNQAFVNALMTITDLAEDILILSPYYFNNIMAIKLTGCNPIIVRTDEKYQPRLQEIIDNITVKTKAIITISPNNPTGAVYSKRILEGINKFCADSGIYHISDEAYEYFVFDDITHTSSIIFDKELGHTISLFSFSKSFGMSGYRVGYMVYPSKLHNELLKVQDTIGICPPGPSQAAAEAALKVGSGYPKKFLPTMAKVRKMFIDRLKDLDYLEIPETHGSFYFLLKLNTKHSSEKIAKHLIEDFGVITIPGEVFGAEDPTLRISYGNLAASEAQEGINRLIKGLEYLLRNRSY